MSIPEPRPDYAKLAEDALRRGLEPELARALQSCAADLAAAKSEADNSHYWYEEARSRLAAAEKERDEALARSERQGQNVRSLYKQRNDARAEHDRLAAALEEIARGDSFGSIHLQEIAREALAATNKEEI